MAVTRYDIPDLFGNFVKISRAYRNGSNSISGVTKVGSAAISCPVLLFEYPNMYFLEQTLSDANGNYLFKFLDPAYQYAVIARHPLMQYNGVMGVGLTPV